jgi:hypothetical protein
VHSLSLVPSLHSPLLRSSFFLPRASITDAKAYGIRPECAIASVFVEKRRVLEIKASGIGENSEQFDKRKDQGALFAPLCCDTGCQD